MVCLKSQEGELVLDPWNGGSIASFKWRGIDIFRPFENGKAIVDYASFPLVPFCNRIAHGHIIYARKRRALPAAPAGLEPNHALHGIGWTSPWAVREASHNHVVFGLHHDGALWPWRFEAEQRFDLTESGLRQTMSITNLDAHMMPAGLGFHPYFPRAGAKIEMEAKGVWTSGKDRLPERYVMFGDTPDWFAGDGFDNCIVQSGKTVSLDWPSHRLTITPSANLSFMHVYTPPGEDFFCVEPVSHIPDAVNNSCRAETTGLVSLEPQETMTVACLFEPEVFS